MIIEFSATDQALESVEVAKLLAATKEVLRAHRNGNHLAIIDRPTAAWIREQLPLDPIDRSTLDKLSGEYAQIARLRYEASLRIFVDLTNNDRPKLRYKAIHVGIDDIRNKAILEKLALITENTAADGLLYKFIISVVGFRRFGYPVAFELHNGGGDQIDKVFLENVRETRISAVILDSDRRKPDDAEPRKAHVLRSILREFDWHFGTVVCLPCHEVENLIPLQIVEKLPCAAEKSDQILGLNKIAESEERVGVPENEKLWYFYDLKNGVCRESNEWVDGKIKVGGGKRAAYSGFGNKMVSQLLDKEKIYNEFGRSTGRQSWLCMFEDMFLEIYWLGVSAQRSFV